MAEATPGFSLTGLFSNPDFINMLAGIGAEMDKEGAGGILGRAAITMNKAKAAQKAAQTTLHRNPPGSSVSDIEPTPMLPTPVTTAPDISKLSYAPVDPTARANEISDLLTPPGTEGLTSVSRDKSGEVNVKLTPRKPVVPVNNVQAMSAPAQNALQPEVDDLLDPYMRRRSARQETSLIATGGGVELVPPVKTGTGITPQGRKNDRSIILTPRSSDEDYEAAVRQGARRRNLDEAKALELVGSTYEAARKQRGVDQERFKTDPQYSVNVTLDYLDALAEKQPSLRPATNVATTEPQAPGQALTTPALRTKSDMVVDIEKESPSGDSILSPKSAEAATPPVATQVADLLDLPIANAPRVSPSGLPESIALDIVKDSPSLSTPAKRVAAELVSAIPQYDLRGLNPAEVNAVVGRALEARQIEAAAAVAGTQLVETQDGYAVVNRRTGTTTPLSNEASRTLKVNKFDQLSEFSRDMSITDSRLRPKMNESQAKTFEFGSRALQANERQERLERKYADNPEAFANQRTYILQTLESLPADVPMNVVNQILTGGSLLAGAAKSAYQEWIAQNPKASETERIKVLTSLGLGASESRAVAIFENRKALSADERNFLQNTLDFSIAMLRRDSGAAINAGEYLNTYRQYFPTVGDEPKDVRRKLRTRQQAIRGMRESAGRPLLAPDVED